MKEALFGNGIKQVAFLKGRFHQKKELLLGKGHLS